MAASGATTCGTPPHEQVALAKPLLDADDGVVGALRGIERGDAVLDLQLVQPLRLEVAAERPAKRGTLAELVAHADARAHVPLVGVPVYP